MPEYITGWSMEKRAPARSMPGERPRCLAMRIAWYRTGRAGGSMAGRGMARSMGQRCHLICKHL